MFDICNPAAGRYRGGFLRLDLVLMYILKVVVSYCTVIFETAIFIFRVYAYVIAGPFPTSSLISGTKSKIAVKAGPNPILTQ